jgi:general secretion pathway protein E
VAEAVEQACYNQTSFVEAVLDCEGVRERDFLLAMAHTLNLTWWEGGGDKPAEPGLRRHLPAEIALRHRILPVKFEEPSDSSDVSDLSDRTHSTLHLVTFDPLNLVTHQRVASSVPHNIVWHIGQRTKDRRRAAKALWPGCGHL